MGDEQLKTCLDGGPESNYNADSGMVGGGTEARGGEGAAASDPVIVDGDDMEEYSVGAAPDDDDDISVGTAEGRSESQDKKNKEKYELVDCRFEKIGDINGVFYHLGKRHAVSVM